MFYEFGSNFVFLVGEVFEFKLSLSGELIVKEVLLLEFNKFIIIFIVIYYGDNIFEEFSNMFG